MSVPDPVVPAGKYHSALGVDAQSETERPVGPLSSWADGDLAAGGLDQRGRPRRPSRGR